PPEHEGNFSGWAAGTDAKGKKQRFRVPFVYATNGREYFKQIETESGVWFRDVRKSTNLERPLSNWHTPEGLEKLLKKDIEAAHEKLKQSPLEQLGLRDYQM